MDRLQIANSELLSSTLGTSESTWTKFSREIDLFGTGIAAIPAAAKDALVNHPGSTVCKGAAATVLSAGLAYASSCRAPIRLGAQIIGVGLGVAALSDGARSLSVTSDIVLDTWRSPTNFQRNCILMQTQFAPLAVDTAVSLSGATLGGCAGRAFLGAPAEFKLPDFTRDGKLPPGIHQAGWQEFSSRYGGTPRRSELLINMETLLQELRKRGGDRVYVGGSFITTKPAPNDFDMTWRVSGERLGELNKTAPILTDRALQKSTLQGELMATYPNSPGDGVLGFLRQNRGTPVGVVELDLSSLPSRTSFVLRQAYRKFSIALKSS